MHYQNPHPQQTPMQQIPMQQLTPQQQQFLMLQHQGQFGMQQGMQPQGTFPNQFQPQQFNQQPQVSPQQLQQMIQLLQQQQQQIQQLQQQTQQVQPQGNSAMLGTSRFSGANVNAPQFTSTHPQTSSRFNTGQPVQPPTFNQPQPSQQPTQAYPSTQQVVEQAPAVEPKEYAVKPITHKFVSNEKIKLHTITSEVKSTNIRYIDKIVASTDIRDVIECLIEEAYEDPENIKTITAQKLVVSKVFHSTTTKDTVNNLLKLDIRDLYKQLKTTYSEAEDKYAINALDHLDNVLTCRINDFLSTRSKQGVSIDSFLTDFSDLLKVIRNSEETLEDDLLDYMDKTVASIGQLCDYNTEEEPKGNTVISEPYHIAYLDRHLLETGLDNVGEEFVVLSETASNLFLSSMSKTISTVLSTSGSAVREFLLVTLDRSVFKFMLDENSKVYVRLYS